MQGLAGFWQREQRALKSQRPVADSSVIQRYWPDAPVPQLKELRTPQPPPKREGQPPAPDGQGPEPQLPEGEEISDGEAKRMLEEFRQSETCQQIRDTIRSDPQELESFLEELTKSNPELIKAIAKHQTDFLRILTTGFTIKAKAEPDELVEEAEVLPPPPPAVVASQRKARREAKAARQARNAMQPLSSTCHTLATAVLCASPWKTCRCAAPANAYASARKSTRGPFGPGISQFASSLLPSRVACCSRLQAGDGCRTSFQSSWVFGPGPGARRRSHGNWSSWFTSRTAETVGRRLPPWSAKSAISMAIAQRPAWKRRRVIGTAGSASRWVPLLW